jgi:hypothetical protein
VCPHIQGLMSQQIYSEEIPFAGCAPYGAVLRVLRGERPERTLYMVKRGMNDVLWDYIQKWWSHDPQKRLLSQPPRPQLRGERYSTNLPDTHAHWIYYRD